MFQTYNTIPPTPQILSVKSQSSMSSYIAAFGIFVLIVVIIVILGAIGFGVYKLISNSNNSNNVNQCNTTLNDLLPNGDCIPKCPPLTQRCGNTKNCCRLNEDCVGGICIQKCPNSTYSHCGTTSSCFDPSNQACSIPNDSNGNPNPSAAVVCPKEKLNKYGKCCATNEIVNTIGECQPCSTPICNNVCCSAGQGCINGSCCDQSKILPSSVDNKTQVCCQSPLNSCLLTTGQTVCCGIDEICSNGKCVQTCGPNLTCDPNTQKCYEDLNQNYSCIFKNPDGCGNWGNFTYDPPLYYPPPQDVNQTPFSVAYDGTKHLYYNSNSIINPVNTNTNLSPINIAINTPDICLKDVYCEMKAAQKGELNTSFTPTIDNQNVCRAQLDPSQVLLQDKIIKCPLVPDINQSCCKSGDGTYTGQICNGRCWQNRCVCREGVSSDFISTTTGGVASTTAGAAASIDTTSYAPETSVCDIVLDKTHLCNINGAHPEAVIDWSNGSCVNNIETCVGNGNILVDPNDSTLFKPDPVTGYACKCAIGWTGSKTYTTTYTNPTRIVTRQQNCFTPLAISQPFIDVVKNLSKNDIASASYSSLASKNSISPCARLCIFVYGCTITNPTNIFNSFDGPYNVNGYTFYLLSQSQGNSSSYVTFDLKSPSGVKQTGVTINQNMSFLSVGDVTISGTNNYVDLKSGGCYLSGALPNIIIIGFNV